MRTNQWSNVRGSFMLELDDCGLHLMDLQTEVGLTGPELDFLRPFLADPDHSEIRINFLSSGEYTPMFMHGGPDGLGWPEDGCEERLFDSADVVVGGEIESKLPQEIGQKLFDLFRIHIDDVELEFEREDSE